MFDAHYHFITTWHLEGDVATIFAILSTPCDLVRWWPSVYLAVHQREAGDENGVGASYDLHTKGWLPYTLRWSFRTTQRRYPDRIALQAWGDFVGQGVWTLVQRGSTVEVIYDWQIHADKPLLRWLTPLLRPIFAANHRWAMNQGELALRQELARRQTG